jgi:type II secretory ATPase GspE/PulE/Tfp pilus assembly ATPase PilB-like protein
VARPTNRELRDAAGSEFARRLSPEYMEEYCVLPLDLGDDGRLRVAVGNALNTSVLDELRLALGHPLALVDAPAAEIRGAILSIHPDDTAEVSVEAAGEASLEAGSGRLDDLRALANEAPVIQLVNLMLLEALKQRASDVHLESTAQGLSASTACSTTSRSIHRATRRRW